MLIEDADAAWSRLAILIKRRSTLVVLTETCDTKRIPVQDAGMVLLQRQNKDEPGPAFVGFELTGALPISDDKLAVTNLLIAVAEKRPASRRAIEEIVMPMVQDRGIHIMYI